MNVSPPAHILQPPTVTGYDTEGRRSFCSQAAHQRESGSEYICSEPLKFWITGGRWNRNRTCNLRYLETPSGSSVAVYAGPHALSAPLVIPTWVCSRPK